jgi:two-component system, chemotaxis family, chemotaxis protein CheY
MVECLLIESNCAERQRLARLLAELGIDCAQREKTEEGLDYYRQRIPAVVMMEASAQPSTMEFLHKVNLKAKDGRPVVILYADHPDFDAVVQSIHEGAAEFMARPFDRDLLKFKLQQAGVLRH